LAAVFRSFPISLKDIEPIAPEQQDRSARLRREIELARRACLARPDEETRARYLRALRALAEFVRGATPPAAK
jgi:hypothetical protein